VDYDPDLILDPIYLLTKGQPVAPYLDEILREEGHKTLRTQIAAPAEVAKCSGCSVPEILKEGKPIHTRTRKQFEYDYEQTKANREEAGLIRSLAGDPEAIAEAKDTIDGMSIAEIQKVWGVDAYIARRRDFKVLTRDAAEVSAKFESAPASAPSPRIRAPKRCDHGVLKGLSCSVCTSAKSRKAG
jgi:hypothetical protein